MNAPINDLLFVYGSLRHNSNHPLARHLREQAKWLGIAEFCGRLFEVDIYPGAVPSNEPAHRIFGGLYRLHEPARILPLLDSYEEFGNEFAEPNEFVRELRQVLMNDRPLFSWIYLYNHPTNNLTPLGHDYTPPVQD